MRCPVCGGPTRVLREVALDRGHVARARWCGGVGVGHPDLEFQTSEVLSPALLAPGAAAVRRALGSALRGLLARARAARVREEVRRRAGPESAASIAADLGVTEARVRQLWSERAGKGDVG